MFGLSMGGTRTLILGWIGVFAVVSLVSPQCLMAAEKPFDSTVESAVKELSSDAKSALDKGKSKGCEVKVQGAEVRLSEDKHFGKAEYRIGEDCLPVLVGIEYRESAPKDARGKALASQSATAALASTAQAGKTLAVDQACTVWVWEEDVVGIQMIALENHTSWSSEQGKILEGRVAGRSYRYLDWWHLNGQPTVSIGFVNEPYSAASAASAIFYCEGTGSVSSYVCPTPAYVMTLSTALDFDGGGNCGGRASFNGNVVPGGTVSYSVTRS